MSKRLAMLQKKGLVPCAWRAFGVLGGRCFSAWEQWRAKRKSTYLTRVDIDAADFPHFFRMDDPSVIPAEDRETISSLSASFREHRFDLLGSGWIKIFRGMVPEGLMGVAFEPKPVSDSHKPFDVNQANRAEAERIWNLIPKKNYEPIHWHIAYRSGYEWSAKAWRTEPRKNLPRGVDLKEPWELSRMQHLVIMAVDALQKPDLRDEIAEEIESQILDFIANNPPSFGVNWVCTMDVALRASTWLICFDLCRSAGIQFSEGFTKGFGRSIYEHAHFIAHHLEWSDLTRGNHYLIDLVGLIFCCAYLPQTPKTKSWLGFSSREFLREIERQFNSDGTHIECSTAYHCFVSETVVYASSLLTAIVRDRGKSALDVQLEGAIGFLSKRMGYLWSPKRRYKKSTEITSDGVSQALTEQLSKMGRVIDSITRPEGSILNFGDNDSGFFVKLGNPYDTSPLKEGNPVLHDLSRSHISYLIKDFLGGETSSWGSSILPAKMGVPCTFVSSSHHGVDIELEEDVPPELFVQKMSIPRDLQLQTMKLYVYPDFGVWIIKNESVFLCVRTCPTAGQLEGHAHQDFLSVAVSFEKEHYIDDPGIPFYTPFPDVAAQYRSSSAHFSPNGITEAEMIGMDVNCFSRSITVTGHGKLLLSVDIDDGWIKIVSSYPLPELINNRFNSVSVSPGYGKLKD